MNQLHHFEIREATAADIPALAQLYRSFLAEQIEFSPIVIENPDFDWANERRLKLNRSNEKIFVADAGKIAGFIWILVRAGSKQNLQRNILKFWKNKKLNVQPKFTYIPHGMIQDCYIEPQFRQSGVGTALVEFAKSWLQSQGISEIVLMVMKENAAGVNFWEKMGFGTYRLIMHHHLPVEMDAKK